MHNLKPFRLRKNNQNLDVFNKINNGHGNQNDEEEGGMDV